ncbi:MAG: alcohol dehydrogenase catalytic domain-containing protein [Nitrospirota bacterium]
MKAAKLYSLHDIRIEDMPIPEVGPREVLLRTRACGICSGDVMPWYIEKKAPLVPGHEPAGEIVETGHDVSSFRTGDRVFVHHHAPCFICRNCRRGDYVQCATWKNTRIIPGGLSEYILIPETNLEHDTLNLPDSLSYEDGTLIEPTACVVKALKRTGIKRGDTVLILGLGVMGQLNVLLSRKYGAGRIIGADLISFRLQKAKEFGADEVIDVSRHALADALRDMTKGKLADVVIVGPNSVEAMRQGLESAGEGGSVLFFTPAKPGETLVIDPNRLYFRDINIITSYSCGPTDTADALEIIEEGTVRADALVTHRFPLEQASDAFALTAHAGDSLKVMVNFNES